MRARFRRLRGEAGESLLELLIAITILGTCVVAIGSGVVLSVKISAIHRSQSTAAAFLHNYAETLQSSYAKCSSGNPPNYAAALPTPSGFNAPTATVAFWNTTSNTFSGTSCPASDPGLQRVTLKLTSTDGFVTESLVVTVRDTS